MNSCNGKNILSRFAVHKPVYKGNSSSQKYYVEAFDGSKYFLIIDNVSRYTRMEAVFKMMKKAEAAGIPMGEPVELGRTQRSNGEHEAYMILNYIDGDDLISLLPSLSINEQYFIGVKAGEILRKIHAIPSSPNTDNAYFARLTYNMEETIENLRRFRKKINYFDIEKAILFYNKHKDLITNGPQCFLHGDYGIHNLIYGKGELKIVDFEISEFGIPWYDFFLITYNSKLSSNFATGQLYGYFSGPPAPEMYTLIALYASIALLRKINKTISDEKLLKNFLEMLSIMLPWIDNIQKSVSVLSFESTQLRQERDNLIMELNNLYNSKSWRITKPLRKLATFGKKCFVEQ